MKKGDKKKNLSSPDVTTDSLMSDLNHTKEYIDTTLIHLNYYTDPDLIDAYSYQLKSAYMKYRFLLRKLQESHQTS